MDSISGNVDGVTGLPEIKFRGQHEKDTFYQAVAMVRKSSRRGRSLRYGLLAIFGILILVTFIQVAASGRTGAWEIARLVPAFLILLFFAFEPQISARSIAVRLWKNEAVRRPMRGKIDQEGITYYIGGKRVHYAWESFARYRKSVGLAALQTKDGILCAFPQSFFETQEDWQEFKVFVEQNVVEGK